MPLSGTLRTHLSLSEGHRKAGNRAIGNKVEKIMHEGIRRNTHAPVSASNPRRPVSVKQAVAISYSMKRKGQL